MEEPLITLIYKLADGKRISIEVTSEVVDALEQSDRQIRSKRRQDRRYLKYTGYIAEFDDHAMVALQEDTADLLIRMDSYKQLYSTLEKLSEVQRRRLIKRFFDGKIYCDIADSENVNYKTVVESIAGALKKLEKLLRADW